ncbi:MAG TPA: ribonuclease HII, partial [Gemmatimonadales bacterium]|nr:ribonuclease HII [Gemmatimonadales bacterium]
AWAEGRLLVGVDEVGRGPLAGPVVAAAVVFPAGCPRGTLRGLRDSKLIPPARREKLGVRIRARATAIGIGAASVIEIDRLNIRKATALAMRRALERVLDRVGPVFILVDGLPFPELGVEHEALVDGDAHCASVAAAGIVAKIVRDDLMHRLARRHPGYGWDTNVGYCTDAHHDGLLKLGPTRHHRQSFAPVAQIPLPF